MLLQLEHNTPEIYSERSRDFQLLCRIIDIYLNAAIESSSKMIHNLETDALDERFLYLQARRLGFTTHKYFPPNILRNICENFPYLIRRKGTLQAVRDAVYTILSANSLVTLLQVFQQDVGDPYTYNIISNVGDVDISYIAELLSFLLPAGVNWTYTGNVNKEFNKKLDTVLQDALVGFRGIGDIITRIMRQPFDQNLGVNADGSVVISRGVDWNYLADDKSKKGYKIDAWGGSPAGTTNVQPYYSKMNVVLITRKKADGTQGMGLESLNTPKKTAGS